MFRFFENLVNPFADFPAETPPPTLWAYVKTQLRPFRKLLPFMALIGLLVALMEMGLIFYLGHVIDLMKEAGPANFWHQNKGELMAAVAFVLLIRPVLIGLDHLLLEQTLGSNMMEQSRWRAHKHMLGQSMGFFQNDFAGRLSNRVMQTGNAVSDSVYMVFEAIWYAGTYVIGAIIVLAAVDGRLAIPLLVWLAIYLLYVQFVARRVGAASEKWSDARSLVTGRIVDAYANIETVKLFATTGSEERYALSALRRLRLRFQRFLRLMTELSIGLNLINGVLIIGVLGTAIWLWSQDLMSMGEVAAAVALVIRLNGMTGWIMWVTVRLFEQAGVIREGLRSIAVDQEVVDKPDAQALVVDRGRVEIRGLTHHYGRETGGLDGIDLVIESGQRIGLIGRSGAGKSSLVNLLLRFRDAEGGDILIDGQSISDVTQDSLRAQIGMVTQDNSLLHRSVRANILYGRPDATEDDMIRAAKQAEAHDFILDLEDPQGRRGYNAQVGERGGKLSGGQRQRIAIARVILKNAPILILDEATSALDSEVEAHIQKTLNTVMEDKTVIAVAHRLSTIARMDRIVVLDLGRVVEDGTHAELLEQGGLYADLWSRQSGGFIDG